MVKKKGARRTNTSPSRAERNNSAAKSVLVGERNTAPVFFFDEFAMVGQ